MIFIPAKKGTPRYRAQIRACLKGNCACKVIEDWYRKEIITETCPIKQRIDRCSQL